jgi:TP901 family phage tail tape measure protein
MSRFVLTAQLQLQAPNNVRQVVQQIQNQLNGITVNVQLQGSQQAQRQLQQITQQANQATTAAERMGRAFALSVRRFAAFSIATRGVSLFTSTLADAVQSAIDFERQLIKVAQVTGKSVSQLRGLTKQITSLSTGFGVASSDLLEVSTVLAQAGLTAEDTSVALRTLAKAALAPNFDSITETAEGAIAILAQFQEGVGALEKQLGSINAVAGAFAVEASDLIDVIRRTGGVFKSSGGSLNELLALFTSVRATTRESAESIGTGLRTIFTRIQRPKTIEFLKQFGVELVDLNGKFVGPFEAVKRLSEALAGLGEGDITFIRIAEELGGFRQIGKVLPLLQQFTTAQQALNVATKANDSLTQDAASAQAALAIRIIKVKEEFLALIRSISETSTFQVMANTALSLASALIKIGDSIKPLLPMLAALAAFRLVKGMGSFFGGMMSGATSGRTYNKGGKVLGFARGGLVPGSGNRDTVPAMLSPGEFVIRKSSVNKMGAGTLAAMNENKYALGGPVGWKGTTFGIAALEGSESPKTETIPTSLIQQKLGLVGKNKQENKSIDTMIRGILGLKGSNLTLTAQSDTLSLSDPGIKEGIYNNIKNQIYGLITSSAGTISKDTGISLRKRLINPNKVLSKVGTDSTIGSVFEGALSLLGSPFISGGPTEALDFPKGIGRLGPAFKNIVGMPVDAKKTVDSKRMGELLNKKAPNFFANFVRRSKTYAAFQANKLNQLSENFDLDEYKRITGNSRATTSDISKIATMSRKVGNRQLFTLREKFAEGGGVGTDTVPALLTPGEFVINRSSAQRIGYGALHRMNKVAKYAKGGVVGPQKFFVGGVAEKQVSRDVGFREIESIDDAAKVMAETLKGLGPEIKKAILDKFQGIEAVTSGGKTSLGTKFKDTTRGQAIVSSSGVSAMGLQIKGKNAAANINTVAHETGHLADSALAGKKGFASTNKGTFQFDLVEKVKPQMEAAFKAAGMNAKDIETYLTKNEELFAEFFAKSSPEVRAIITSTTDSKIGMKKLADHLKKVGHTYAGLEASDITGTPPNKPTRASAMGMSTSNVLAAARSQAASNAPVKNPWATTGGFMGSKTSGGGSPPSSGSPPSNPPSGDSSGGGIGNMLGNNKMMMASMTASIIQGFLPAVDESSSAMLKMTQGLLGLVTTVASVGFALEAFGVKLNAGFFKGVGLSGDGIQSVFNTVKDMGGSTKLAGNIAGLTNAAAKLAGPLLAVAGGAYLAQQAFNIVAESIYNFDGRLKKSIEKGDVEGAKTAARERADFQTGAGAAGGVLAATAAGAAIGSFIPVIGTAVGAIVGLGVGLVGIAPAFLTTTDSAVALAAAQAGAVKTQKSLDEAQKVAATAMDDFKNGTISASEALAKIRAKTEEANVQMGRAGKFAVENLQNRSEVGRGAILRNIGSLGGLNPFMETASARNERLGKESADQINNASKQQQEAFNIESLARQATIRSGIARGKGTEDIRTQAIGNLRSQRTEALKLAQSAARSGDDQTYDAAMAQAKQLGDQIEQVNKEIENIEKEVKRQKDLYDAMNLGLRAATATSSALSANMDRFSAGFEVGGSTLGSDIEFLQQSMSSAAQAMDPNEIKDAVSNVSSNLREFGVGEEYIKRFEGNVAAFTSAQQNYNKAFDNIKSSMAEVDFQGLSSDELKKKFADELTKGMDTEGAKSLKAAIQGMDLSDTDVDQILAGDLSIFGNKLTEVQKKMFEDLQKIEQDRVRAEQVLIDFTRKRIDAERNLVAAQQEALDLLMEGRQIQAKYGGAPVTAGEQRANILGKSNVESNRLGLTAMRTGDPAELRRRNQEIMAGFSAIEARRTQRGGMGNAEGVEADEAQKDLQKAYKTQVDTIRSLIKLEEEQLKITQEKNKLERDSMESLIKGDVEEFFKKQSAVGATAAIASGDQRLMNFYGAEALGMAFQDIQRQQEAGVQSLYGQQLAGPGGLTEAAAGAALSARGLTSGLSAQMLAGTTAEEEASKARLRELGGMLGETGQMGAEMAQMQVETAQMNVNAAQVTFDKTMERGRKSAEEGLRAERRTAAEAVGKARGGLIYANRGIFVPRGTDTVPAMLTPGEFVVNRAAVQRGNNLQTLQAMNNGAGSVSNSSSTAGAAVGMARGGMVRYLANGSDAPEAGSDAMSKFAQSLNEFNSKLSENIRKLGDTTISIKLDSTNVNLNINDGGLLKALKGEVKKELFALIASEFKVDQNGRLTRSSSILG